MRLDKNDRSISAAQILNWYSEKSLQQLFQQVIVIDLFTYAIYFKVWTNNQFKLNR
jgi:hypothetical protein